MPPRAQRPTCVHEQSCSLDPLTEPAIHRSEGATCHLSTSAVVTTHEHDHEPSKPRLLGCSSRSHCATGCLRPLRNGDSHVSPAQESRRLASTKRLPDDRSPCRSTPTREQHEHPLSRNRRPTVIGITQLGDRAVNGLSSRRVSSPGSPRSHEARLVGPPPAIAARTELTVSRTRGAFHHEASRSLDRR